MAGSANTQGFSTNLALPTLPEIDQNKYPEIFEQFLRVQNAIGVLQAALDGYTGVQGAGVNNYGNVNSQQYFQLQNLSRFYVLASEDIGQYLAVNFYNNSGILNARLANATNGRICHAYCSSVGGITSGSIGEFILFGYWPVTGLTPAAFYYLSTTAGHISTTTSADPGTIAQPLGYALGETGLFFNPSFDIVTDPVPPTGP